jgi:hypothetical protein
MIAKGIAAFAKPEGYNAYELWGLLWGTRHGGRNILSESERRR